MIADFEQFANGILFRLERGIFPFSKLAEACWKLGFEIMLERRVWLLEKACQVCENSTKQKCALTKQTAQKIRRWFKRDRAHTRKLRDEVEFEIASLHEIF
jgi:hypothetical protein